MTDLIDFLNARLAEDEAAALGVPTDGAPWHDQWVNDDDHALRTINDHVLTYGHHGEPMKPGLLDHIARHDPARVLREVAAKRRIMERHRPDEDPLRKGHMRRTRHCEGCGYEYGEIGSRVDDINNCPELRDLAAVYNSHPDYREEWAA